MYSETSSEPSGVRLLRLINTRILDIVKYEFSNSDRLCLYGTGGYWTAFEHSAFQLSRIFPNPESFVVNPPGCPFSIVGLTVSEKELKKYLKTHIPYRQNDDYLEFIITPSALKTYDQWHAEIVDSYKGMLQLT